MTRHGFIVQDANGERVALMDAETALRDEANAALIVAAVNAFGPRGRSLPHADDCVLPIGHSGPCVPERSEPRCHTCELGVVHEGPCVVPAPQLSDEPRSPDLAGARRRIKAWADAMKDAQIEVLEGAFYLAGALTKDAAPPLSADCRLPLLHAAGCECGRL